MVLQEEYVERREIKFSNGRLQELYYIKSDDRGNELREGPYISWNENGQKVKFCGYKDGKLDGPCTRWYNKEMVLFECVYREGKIIALK
jgi:antitoxin component YwqK of YwqJK toxin-antitoxin module